MVIRARRSEAAMEFLVTYGWLIIVFLAVIAGLAYFGFIETDTFVVQESCTITPPFSCINFMLGTDGMHSDMLRSAKASFLTGQTTEGIDMAGIYKRFRNVHEYIRLHGFSGDGENNLVILDYDTPTEITSANFTGHFIYGLESNHVLSVIAQGKMIVEERRITGADEAEIIAYAREQGLRLWKKLEEA